MVGTVFIAFCGIVLFQIHQIFSKKVTNTIIRFIRAKKSSDIVAKNDESQDTDKTEEVRSNKISTTSIVELSDIAVPADELREPLSCLRGARHGYDHALKGVSNPLCYCIYGLSKQ